VPELTGSGAVPACMAKAASPASPKPTATRSRGS
jgi:hypothetical protein